MASVALRGIIRCPTTSLYVCQRCASSLQEKISKSRSSEADNSILCAPFPRVPDASRSAHTIPRDGKPAIQKRRMEPIKHPPSMFTETNRHEAEHSGIDEHERTSEFQANNKEDIESHIAQRLAQVEHDPVMVEPLAVISKPKKVTRKSKSTVRPTGSTRAKKALSGTKAKRGRPATIVADAESRIASSVAHANAESELDHELGEPLMEAVIGGQVEDIVPLETIPVPRLAHGLDRVLFNPGVYYLQDPRSHVYNFDPYLQAITPVKDFNFDALTEYITSSRDSTLDELARAHDLQVVGSTSSMTAVLAQFHYFISNWRPVNLRNLSTVFMKKSRQFTSAQRAPASIYLRHNNGIYSIDADKSLDSGETVLSFLGRSMEKMLTLAPKEFARLKMVNRLDAPTEKSREAYHYSKVGRILMRSQLDCQDPRLPGTGSFDLKTRAVLPIRMDVKNAEQNAGYQITQSTGLLESFEREYYDMIRAAFLKYSLQVRIGKMDGIFVAFHNTERIFGFQYISLAEMDRCIHGSAESNVAQREYMMSLKQLDKVLELAIRTYPGQSMALTFAASEERKGSMQIVIESMSEDEIKRRQEGELLEALKAAQLDERIKHMPGAKQTGGSEASLENMSNTLEQMIEYKKKKKQKQKHNNKATRSADKTSARDEKHAEASDAGVDGEPPNARVMLTLTGTNVVDGEVQTGPPQVHAASNWRFNFKIQQSTDAAAINAALAGMRSKQAQAFTDIYEDDDDGFKCFKTDLKRLSDLGRVKLEKLQSEQQGTPIVFKERSRSELEQQYRKNFI